VATDAEINVVAEGSGVTVRIGTGIGVNVGMTGGVGVDVLGAAAAVTVSVFSSESSGASLAPDRGRTAIPQAPVGHMDENGVRLVAPPCNVCGIYPFDSTIGPSIHRG